MGSTIVAQPVLLLGALVPAREDHCAYALSSRELQRKVGAAHQAAISERFEARAQSAKAPTAVHGSPGAPLVLENVGWLASQPAKEHAKPSTRALMGQTKEEAAGAGALQRLQLTPHGAKLMPSELVDAEHAVNTPWTTPCPTRAEVDSIDPSFKNSGGDPRVPEVSFASMERRERPCCQAQHRPAQRVGGGPRAHFDRILLPPNPQMVQSATTLLLTFSLVVLGASTALRLSIAHSQRLGPSSRFSVPLPWLMLLSWAAPGADAQAPPTTLVVEPYMVNSAAELHALLATNQTTVDAYLTPGTHLLCSTFLVSDGKRLTLRSDGAVLDAHEQTRHFLVQDNSVLELEGVRLLNGRGIGVRWRHPRPAGRHRAAARSGD